VHGAVVSYGTLRGVPVGTEPYWLEPKFPAEVKPYRFEISPLDQQLVTGLSMSAAPSGLGELVISTLGYGAGIVTFTAAGGQPTQCYTLLLSVVRTDSMASEYLLKIRVDPVLIADQPQAAPTPEFGMPISWFGSA
jgi:hypothetical protein